MPRSLSANGQIAVTAGYTPGTTEYRNYMRSLQRYTTTAGQQRRSSEARLRQLPPELVTQVQQRERVRDVIAEARRQHGASAHDPIRVTLRANIAVGGSETELRRATRARDVHLTIQPGEQLALLRAGDWERLLKWAFHGDPDAAYPLTATNVQVRAS